MQRLLRRGRALSVAAERAEPSSVERAALADITARYAACFPATVAERCAANRDGLRQIGREAEFPLVHASNGAAFDASGRVRTRRLMFTI